MNMRRGNPNALHDTANPEEWGDSLLAYLNAQRRELENLAPRNEVRWGALRRASLDIPAGSGATILVRPDQILDIRAPARNWTLAFGLNWENAADGTVGETMTAIFLYEVGVGSARLQFTQAVTVAAAATPSTSTLVTPMFPAATIYVSVLVTIDPTVGVARTYNVTATALAAPVVR